jgi:hypothetical protein
MKAARSEIPSRVCKSKSGGVLLSSAATEPRKRTVFQQKKKNVTEPLALRPFKHIHRYVQRCIALPVYATKSSGVLLSGARNRNQRRIAFRQGRRIRRIDNHSTYPTGPATHRLDVDGNIKFCD